MYLSNAFIQCIYPMCLSNRFIQCIYPMCLSNAFIRCIYPIGLSNWFVQWVYLLSLAEKYLIIFVVMHHHGIPRHPNPRQPYRPVNPDF
jgi:hypothetical protein